MLGCLLFAASLIIASVCFTDSSTDSSDNSLGRGSLIVNFFPSFFTLLYLQMINRRIVSADNQNHPPGLAVIISISLTALIIKPKNAGVAGLNTTPPFTVKVLAVCRCFMLADFAGLLFKPGD